MPDKLKLKITGKGHPMTGDWKVKDIETGKELLVTKIIVYADCSGENAKCLIEVDSHSFEVDIEVDEGTVVNG